MKFNHRWNIEQFGRVFKIPRDNRKITKVSEFFFFQWRKIFHLSFSECAPKSAPLDFQANVAQVPALHVLYLAQARIVSYLALTLAVRRSVNQRYLEEIIWKFSDCNFFQTALQKPWTSRWSFIHELWLSQEEWTSIRLSSVRMSRQTPLHHETHPIMLSIEIHVALHQRDYGEGSVSSGR